MEHKSTNKPKTIKLAEQKDNYPQKKKLIKSAPVLLNTKSYNSHDNINRPMIVMYEHRNGIVAGISRMLFATTITIFSCIINVNDNSITENHKLLYTILYFSITMMFIIYNIFYFFKGFNVYKKYRKNINFPICLLSEFLRAVHYICIPLMFSIVLYNKNKSTFQSVVVIHLCFIFCLFFSNAFDKFTTRKGIFIKLFLLVITNSCIIYHSLINPKNHCRACKIKYQIYVESILIFFSLFLSTQKRFLFSYNVKSISHKPYFINTVINCLFFTFVYVYITYRNPLINRHIVAAGGFILAFLSLFKPILFDSFQLYIVDRGIH